MSHRAQSGYVLPGQMDILYPIDNCIARMGNGRRVLISSLAMPKSQNLFCPEKSWDIKARSIAAYNNSFDALVKDLKEYSKKAIRCLFSQAPGQEQRELSRIFGTILSAHFTARIREGFCKAVR
jgi:hypothetical protein